MTNKITITEDGEFNCLYGNYPNAEGAYACDSEGNYIENGGDDYPGQPFRCDRCGIIFNVDTGEIVGRYANNPENSHD